MTEWRPVAGWEGLYEVSNEGRIARLPRRTQDGKQLDRRILRGVTMKSGHLAVTLQATGRRQRRLAHRIIAEAFLPNPDGLPLVLHWNDVPDDNRVENLRYGTRSDNSHDAVRNGRHHLARAETCVNGHLWTKENTRQTDSQRVCRRCVSMRSARHRNRVGEDRYNPRLSCGQCGKIMRKSSLRRHALTIHHKEAS